MAESGDNGTNLSTRARAWFERLSRLKKVLATSAALMITVGGVASATSSVLDLGGRLGAGRSETPRVSPIRTSVQSMERVREGVRVTEVFPGSSAARAGVEVQDVVTDINGKGIEDVDDFEDALNHAQPGQTLLLSIVRDSRRESVPVKLKPIEGTDLLLGARTENIEPDDVVTLLERSPLSLPGQETTTPGPQTMTTTGQESTGGEPPRDSPEPNSSGDELPAGSPEPKPPVDQYAP